MKVEIAPLPVRLQLTAAWDNLVAAYAIKHDCCRISPAGDLWRDPVDGRVYSTAQLLHRLRRDATPDDRGYVLAIERVEDLLVRAGGARAALAPPGLSGIRWQLPDEDGVPRTTIEAAAIVRARALREELDASFPALVRCDGPSVVRSPEYDQRNGDEQEPADEPANHLPDWIEKPHGYTPVHGTRLRPHAPNIAPAREGGQSG